MLPSSHASSGSTIESAHDAVGGASMISMGTPPTPTKLPPLLVSSPPTPPEPPPVVDPVPSFSIGGAVHERARAAITVKAAKKLYARKVMLALVGRGEAPSPESREEVVSGKAMNVPW